MSSYTGLFPSVGLLVLPLLPEVAYSPLRSVVFLLQRPAWICPPVSDAHLRELERRWMTSGNPADWTALAITSQRVGLIWPPPPNSFCPGFRFMGGEEIMTRLEADRGRRVEAVFAPNHCETIGYFRDWPPENVSEDGLPYWTKTRFWVGRSTGRVPVLLKLPLRTSSGGGAIYPGEFVYVRRV